MAEQNMPAFFEESNPLASDFMFIISYNGPCVVIFI